MAGLAIRPFTEQDIDAAATLLAARHDRHREVEPLLPADVDFRAQIESEWHVEGASGVIALRGDDAVGYLVGRPLPFGSAEAMITGIGGHAVEGDPELARDLYAAAAGQWFGAGHMRHVVFVPAPEDALVDSWFRLSFGASGILAMRQTARQQPIDVGVEMRRSTSADIEATARLDRAMGESMQPSPSFSSSESASWTDEQYVDDWRDTWTDDRHVHFVAVKDSRIVSHILLYRRPADLRVPKESIDLAAASTFPELRGSGVGRALTEYVIDWAYESGYPVMTTDWPMTNLLASRFWPKRSFRPAFIRLYRNVL